jgi:protoporphyrinogen oxidase
MNLEVKSINEIEQEAFKYQTNYVEARREFIQIMLYLEQTERFKENPKFKKASFSEYLRDQYGITYHQYYTERIAYGKYSDKVDEYGFGVVNRIVKTIPKEKQPKVFSVLDKKRKSRKTELSPAEVDSVTKSFQKKRKKKKVPTPSQMKKSELEKEVTDLRAYCNALEKEREELYAQVAKLKKAVIAKENIIKDKDIEILRLKNENNSGNWFNTSVFKNTIQPNA